MAEGLAIRKTGYLRKRGQHRKTWYQRWFILRGDGNFSYYTSEDDPTYLGNVSVDNADVAECENKDGNPYCFVIKSHHRSLYLSAESEAERVEWLIQLNACRGKLRKHKPPTEQVRKFHCDRGCFLRPFLPQN